MHRATPLGTSFRAYVSGGARAAIHDVEDKFGMQTSKANFMKNETRENIESPQNYGFTSVCADGDKDKDGQLSDGPEAAVSFMGGNRSFPMMGAMDDRRHRLLNLAKDAAKGATAMFGLREWGQQFLNTEDGMHMTGNKEKKIRIQLVENKNKKQQQQGQQQQADAGGGGSSGSGSGKQQKEKGQKSLHKEQTDINIEQNGQSTTSQHGQAYSAQKSGSDSSTYYTDRKKSSQSTEDHTHIRFKDNRIYNDKDGNWCTSPLLVKKDEYCKE